MSEVQSPLPDGGPRSVIATSLGASFKSHNGSTSRLDLTTVRESTMLHIVNYITDKPDWRAKVSLLYPHLISGRERENQNLLSSSLIG